MTTNGSVASITVTSGGSGYTHAPSVTIFGGGGSGATAAAIVSNGTVSAVSIQKAGSGYTTTPNVTIASPPLVGNYANIQPGVLLEMQNLMTNQVSIACLQECRWDSEEIGNKIGDYKLWGGGAWRNSQGARQGGVGFAIHKSLWSSVEQFQLLSGRVAVMSFKGQLHRRLIICSVRAPIETDGAPMKEQFWVDVNKAMKGPDGQCCSRDILILAGDFNGEYHHIMKSIMNLTCHSLSPAGVWDQRTAMVCGFTKKQLHRSYVLWVPFFGNHSKRNGPSLELLMFPSLRSGIAVNMTIFSFHSGYGLQLLLCVSFAILFMTRIIVLCY